MSSGIIGTRGSSGRGSWARARRGREAPRESFHLRGTEVLPGGRELASSLLPKVVPQELDRKDPVAVQLLDLRVVAPAALRLQGRDGLPDLHDLPADLVVLVRDDAYEAPVSADLRLQGREQEALLPLEVREQLVLEEPDRLVEEVDVRVGGLAGLHHLVEGRLKFRLLLGEVPVARPGRH